MQTLCATSVGLRVSVVKSPINTLTTEAQRSHKEPQRRTLDSLLLIHMLDSFSQFLHRTQRTPKLRRLNSCRALAFSRDRECSTYCLVIRIASFDQPIGRLCQIRFGNYFVGCCARAIEDWPQLLS